MKLIRLCICLLVLFSNVAYSEEELSQQGLFPIDASHVNWVFSGVVTNENNEEFAYFFQMQRDNDQFHVVTALFDIQNKRLLSFEEAAEKVAEPILNNWQVGRAFLRFNPINDSWVFGLKTKNKEGFNFKVDMLGRSEKTPAVQDLRPGVELIVTQTGHLNGHFQAGIDSKEQFVTTKKSWFRQVWLTEKQDKDHPFSGLLCRFNDGSGLYSVSMHEKDAISASVSGSCDEQGIPMLMSQFINVEEAQDGLWHIKIATPKKHWVLDDVIKQSSVVAGFVTEGNRQGFCMMTENVLHAPVINKIIT